MSDVVQSHAVEGTETREEIKQLAEISASKSQASTSHNEVLLDIRDEELLSKLGQALEEELPATERQRVWPNGKNRVQIKRIPEIMVRNENMVKYFEPKYWNIGYSRIRHGDFYHDDMNVHFLYRRIELKLAALFISETGSTREVILKDFKGKMDGIKACFDEDIIRDLEDEEFIRMLFLDGCNILGFIHCYMNGKLEVVGISDAQAGDILWELLLLENQIPFQVLEVLIGLGMGQKDHLKSCFLEFILVIYRRTFPRYSPEDLYEYLDKYCFSPEIEKDQKAVHLLDVFREALLFNCPSFDLLGCMLTVIRGTFRILCSCGCVATNYFLKRFKPEPYYNVISVSRTAKEFFPSVQELKAVGIKFKPSHSLTTVSFRSRFYFRPQLMLPTLIVDDSTASKLLNLVAYEICLSESRPCVKPWVTSYVNLLDSLVDNEQDIKDLRASDILRNTLSTDILAAELINNVGAGCVAPTSDAYADVKEKIGKYYRTTCAVWMAQVCSTHFSSPWTTLALFAATAVLVLTAVQTWYAVNPKK